MKIMQNLLATAALSVAMIPTLVRAEFVIIQPAENKADNHLRIVENNATKVDPLQQELARLRLENARLRAELDYRTQQVAAVYKPAVQTENTVTVPVYGHTATFKMAPSIKKDILAKAKKAKSIVITGYTDTTGSDAVNLKVGMARAKAFKTFLVRSGIASNKIEVKTVLGNYVATNKTDAGRAQNRRVTIDFGN